MTTPKRVDAYPVYFLDVADFIEHNHEPFVIETGSRSAGLALRRLLYGFKVALAREPALERQYMRFVAAAVSVDEKGTVTVLCRDDTPYAKAMREALDKVKRT